MLARRLAKLIEEQFKDGANTLYTLALGTVLKIACGSGHFHSSNKGARAHDLLMVNQTIALGQVISPDNVNARPDAISCTED